MKPIPSAPLTAEDCEIWDGVLLWIETAYTQCHDADRRDAALMLQAHEMRAVFRKFNPLVAGFDDTDRINCGGSLRDLWCSYPHLVPP